MCVWSVRDAAFYVGANMYEWTYVSPIPWDIVAGTLVALLFFVFLAYFEYRRRVKKAAMERYCILNVLLNKL